MMNIDQFKLKKHDVCDKRERNDSCFYQDNFHNRTMMIDCIEH